LAVLCISAWYKPLRRYGTFIPKFLKLCWWMEEYTHSLLRFSYLTQGPRSHDYKAGTLLE
jgi:hypothetical protein